MIIRRPLCRMGGKTPKGKQARSLGTGLIRTKPTTNMLESSNKTKPPPGL